MVVVCRPTVGFGKRLPDLGAGNRHDLAVAQLSQAPASIYSAVAPLSVAAQLESLEEAAAAQQAANPGSGGGF